MVFCNDVTLSSNKQCNHAKIYKYEKFIQRATGIQKRKFVLSSQPKKQRFHKNVNKYNIMMSRST